MPCAREVSGSAATTSIRAAQIAVSRVFMGVPPVSGEIRAQAALRSASGREVRVRRGGDDDDHARDDSLDIVVKAEDFDHILVDEQYQYSVHISTDATPSSLERGAPENDRGEGVELEAAPGEGTGDARAREQRDAAQGGEEARERVGRDREASGRQAREAGRPGVASHEVETPPEARGALDERRDGGGPEEQERQDGDEAAEALVEELAEAGRHDAARGAARVDLGQAVDGDGGSERQDERGHAVPGDQDAVGEADRRPDRERGGESVA